MIKLAYIEYPYKVSFGAVKQFYDRTGLDLDNTLYEYMQAYRSMPAGIDQIEQTALMTRVCSKINASELFHALFVAENSCVSLEEIQDGMQRVTGRYNPDDDECSHPWPLVLVKLAYEVDEYNFNNIKGSKKKADSSDSAKQKEH